MTLKKFREKLNKLSVREKVELSIALFLTTALIIAIPVMAWFAYQRQAATMARINSPAKLSIKSGYAEDIINFKISGIDVGDGDKADYKDFVFCVEGEDVTSYNLQIARTTNINFTYTLYKAHSVPDRSIISTDTRYEDADKAPHYYRAYDEFIDNENSAAYGGYINASAYGNRTIGSNLYTEKSYDTGDVRQSFAEPLYWQTKAPVIAKAVDSSGSSFDEYYNFYNKNADNKFLNFYVLRVSWAANEVTNDKETDLIYITAQVN